MKRTIAEVYAKLEEHAKSDKEHFDAQDKKLEAIHADVKSLLDSRSFARGAWKAITIIAGATATVVTLLAKAIGGH